MTNLKTLLGTALVCSPLCLFAQEAAPGITIPEELQCPDISQIFSDLAANVATPLFTVMGILVGVWAIRFVIAKVRGR